MFFRHQIYLCLLFISIFLKDWKLLKSVPMSFFVSYSMRWRDFLILSLLIIFFLIANPYILSKCFSFNFKHENKMDKVKIFTKWVKLKIFFSILGLQLFKGTTRGKTWPKESKSKSFKTEIESYSLTQFFFIQFCRKIPCQTQLTSTLTILEM